LKFISFIEKRRGERGKKRKRGGNLHFDNHEFTKKKEEEVGKKE
jgi:hypothetical protein